MCTIGAATRTWLAAPLSFVDVGPCAFHGWPVRAALGDYAVSRFGLGGRAAWGGLESGILPWYLSKIQERILNHTIEAVVIV